MDEPTIFNFQNLTTTVVGIVVLLLIVLAILGVIRASMGLPMLSFIPAIAIDQTPTAVDGKTVTTIPASAISAMSKGSDYGMQFWMYIKDWDYKFGKEKIIVQRADSSNPSIISPRISLHPTENSLNVTVSIFPAGSGGAQSSSPAPSNGTGANGDSFTCTVENVPLQSWFSVSTTIFQRNLDVYINGQLVKSCVLPGVPKPAVGDVQIGVAGGFSGSVCNLHVYPEMLAPSDARTFHAAGTTCGYDTPVAGAGGSSMTIFGYTFTFGVKNNTGKELVNYTF